jgi:hypothetical protein
MHGYHIISIEPTKNVIQNKFQILVWMKKNHAQTMRMKKKIANAEKITLTKNNFFFSLE